MRLDPVDTTSISTTWDRMSDSGTDHVVSCVSMGSSESKLRGDTSDSVTLSTEDQLAMSMLRQMYQDDYSSATRIKKT